jgi:NAD-dependent dihydropyrimidine dehydrogenase PreA subunit
MCHWCTEHGRGQIWYDKFENYLFKKIFPSPREQEEAKQKMVATFTDTEWRYSEPEYIRNVKFLKERVSHGFAAQIITKEEMIKVLQLAEEATKREDSMVVVGHCPCNLVYRGTREYCCIGFGMPVSMSMEIGYGRLPREGLTEFGGAEWRELRNELRKGAKVPLHLDEAKGLIEEWEKRGRWHLIVGRGRMPLIEAICNCERPYCTYWRNRQVSGVKEYCLKGHFVARINPDKCTACGACTEQCQFGAIHTSVWEDITNIDVTMCFGCGICRQACKHDAIEMVPRERIPIARNLW